MTKPMDDLMQQVGFTEFDLSAGRREMIMEFAQLVAKKAVEVEREACARFVEEVYVRQFENPWREDLAAAIRARGEKK